MVTWLCGVVGLWLLLGTVALATVHPVANTTELTTALGAAVAGDEIVLANGTYSGAFLVNGNSGSAGTPITLRAQNQHQAILTGTNTCGGTTGLDISESYWVIKDLVFRDYNRALWLRDGVTNVEIAHNLIDHFWQDGIRVAPDYPNVSGGADANWIHHNVVAFGEGCLGTGDVTDAGIYLVNGADQNLVEHNIIVGTGDNGYQAGSKNGYGMLITGQSDDNTVRGNLFLMNGGKGVLRVLADDSYIPFSSNTADRNVIRDNFFFWGEGGVSTDDCSDDSNTFTNNIHLGEYFSLFSAKGQPLVGGPKGHHTVTHNTFFLTEFSRAGVRFESTTGTSNCNGTKRDNTFQNNLLYSPNATAAGTNDHFLLYADTHGLNFATAGYNLFWSPSALATWQANYTYQGSDIRTTGGAAEPVFGLNGNFTLQPGSPGTQAASDGTDIGASYNSALKLAWHQRAWALETQQVTTSGQSQAFTVDPASYYGVWFYVPTSPCAGATTFTIEGVSTLLTRDINTLNTSTWTQAGGPARWITLGKHRAPDGTLNISWTNSATCVGQLFLRRMPTAAEAYTWIQNPAPTVTITTPTSAPTYASASSPLTTLGGTASADTTSVTWSNARGGSGTATGTTSWSVASLPLQDGVNVLTLTATDMDFQTGTAQLTVTYTPPPPVQGLRVVPARTHHFE